MTKIEFTDKELNAVQDAIETQKSLYETQVEGGRHEDVFREHFIDQLSELESAKAKILEQKR